jgi:hypothetical protein
MAVNHPYLQEGMVQDRLHVHLGDNEMDATCDPSNIAFVPENRDVSWRFSDLFVNHDLRELILPLLRSLEAHHHQLLLVL